MRFSPNEVNLARQLKTLGLPWNPQPGHYVWDDAWLIDCPTPFHDRVFFILDLKHFLRRAGTVESLKDALIWLPTWHDARDILQSLDVSHELVAERLEETKGISNGQELATLYQMIHDELPVQVPTAVKASRTIGRRIPNGRADLNATSPDKR